MRALVLFKNGKSLQVLDNTWPPPDVLAGPDIGIEYASRKLARVRVPAGEDGGTDVALKPIAEAKRRLHFRLVKDTFEPKRPEDLAICEEVTS